MKNYISTTYFVHFKSTCWLDYLMSSIAWRQQTCCRLAARPDPHVWLCRPAGRVVHNQRSRPVFVQLTLSLFPPAHSLTLHELTLSRIAFTRNDWAMCVVFNVCNRVKVVPVNFRLPHYTCSCKTVKLCYGSSHRFLTISERNVFGWDLVPPLYPLLYAKVQPENICTFCSKLLFLFLLC